MVDSAKNLLDKEILQSLRSFRMTISEEFATPVVLGTQRDENRGQPVPRVYREDGRRPSRASSNAALSQVELLSNLMKVLTSGAVRLGLLLTQEQISSFKRYYQELSVWNNEINLTSVTGCENVQRRHFLDSLSVVLALRAAGFSERGGERLLDVGSGAGFPGLPLAIAFPNLQITLLESVAKKSRFLEHAAVAIGMANVSVVTGRAETMAHNPEMRESFDYVTERGVAKLAALAEIMLPFCKINGLAIAMKGTGVEQEVEEAAPAIKRMGGTLRKVLEVDMEYLQRPATLVVMAKERPTPALFPRRPGMPAKRPILL